MWTAQNSRAEKKFQEGNGEDCEKRWSEKGAAEAIGSTPGRAGEPPGCVRSEGDRGLSAGSRCARARRAEDAGRASASLENFDPEKLKIL